MTTLRVDPAGLSAFASSCSFAAAVLRASLVDADPGPACQASGSVVAAADDRIAAAASALAARAEEMSQALATSAADYRNRDQASAVPITKAMGSTDR
ncbi:type VII secretion target [Mycolicibacterium vanbaalenii]|uniref:type VII secretion target n=1 Tax=Mycolicibacterium vanbaalenii TaxID=110539 RepID=UPI0023BA6B3E|nr:type VII secretion target [Mycolicibacterium vanbaalenii]